MKYVNNIVKSVIFKRQLHGFIWEKETRVEKIVQKVKICH